MDPVTAEQHNLPTRRSQASLETRTEGTTAAQIVTDHGQNHSHEPTREPSRIRLAVILGGLWVGHSSVSLGEQHG